MKSKLHNLIVMLALLALCTLHTALSTASAQGTAFTYQGQLQSGGSPANGNYDFEFSLFNASSGGSQVGSTQTNLDMGVTDGFFTVTLNFGDVLTGNATWLAIGVRTNGSATFTALNPLQELTPTPYAIFAEGANAAGLTGTIPAGSISGTDANEVAFNNGADSFDGTFYGDFLGATFLGGDFTGTFIGDGSSVINLNASQLSAGTLPSARFGGLYTNAVTISNANNGFSGTFAGNGSGLTSVPAASLTGVIALAQLPAAVVTNDATSVTIGGTNVVAPLTVPPNLPASSYTTLLSGVGAAVNSAAVAGCYVYVVNADNSTLQVVDVSTPSAPVVVGSAGTGNGPYSVAVAGRYAYVVNNNNGSAGTLQVIDVSTPANPVNVGSVGTGKGPFCVAVAGRYAYVVNEDANSLQIFDVSNPSAPVSVGSAGTGSEPIAVAVAGRYAYVVNLGSNTLQVFDVSTPSAPYTYASAGTGSEPIAVAVAGRYAYVVNAASNTMQIFDVSFPYPPVLVGSVGTGDIPQSVAVDGRYAYVANFGDNTLQVFDVSTPSAPVIAGSSFTGLINPTFVAVAGRYAYVLGDAKFEVVNLGGAYIQQLEAGAMMTGTLQTRDTVTVGNNLDVRGGLTVSASARISGGLSVDSGTITATNFSGNGSSLTGLNAAQLSGAIPSSGVSVPAADLTGALPVISGSNLTGLNASQLSSGLIPNSVLPGFQSGSNYNSVDGGQGNSILSGSFWASINGGNNNNNQGIASTIAGGQNNTINGTNASGGVSYQATVSGGYGNTASANYSTIGGGANNLVNAYWSTIGGGNNNFITSSGTYATIPGGYQNLASGSYSFAAGNDAQALHQGAFVWADSQNAAFSSTTSNQFNVRANGGARFVTTGAGMTLDGQPVFAGNNGSGLTGLNASQLSSGVVPNAVLPGFQSSSNYNSVDGGQGNSILSGSFWASINGGNNNNNQGIASTIAGGQNNTINGTNASGGVSYQATVSGGYGNTASANYSTIGGGANNLVNAYWSTIGGGNNNFITSSGTYATIPGGYENLASGTYSFAAGEYAQATNNNSFVWCDGSATNASITNNSVTLRATNGLRFFTGTSGAILFTNANGSGSDQFVSWTPGSGAWSFTSDRAVKDRFEAVDTKTVLDKVAQLPISEWSYKGYGQRHIGAMAQDFHALFSLNDNDKALNDADLHGVELAAIKGLNQKLEAETKEKDAEIQNLKQSLAELKEMVQTLAERK